MALLHLTFVAATFLGDPPSPAAADAALVVELHTNLREGRLSDEQYTRQLCGIAANLDFDRLTAQEIDQFSQGWFFDVTSTHERVMARLSRLSLRRDHTGMLAACARVRVMPRSQWHAPDVIKFIRAPLLHPGWLPSADPDSNRAAGPGPTPAVPG
jgi:hypothetical protein